MSKKTIAAGFDALIPAAKTQPAEAKPQTPARSYKTVCYSLPVDLAEKVRNIAYWDRKKLNAVVSEALAEYCARWKPSADAAPENL